MDEELFDQSLKTVVAETDRMATGIPGQNPGCDNTLFPNVRKSMYKGETGKSLTTGVNNIAFTDAFPSTDYVLFVSSTVAYQITNKAVGGFDIEPLEATTIDYIAILL